LTLCFTESTGHTYIGQPYGDEVKPCEYNYPRLEGDGTDEILRL